ncbi:hypothetical protein [Proteus vulgaris]|uniref:hypothetical protein n=1 Tax=Proteus vulgaris TaxID=585 RepID=UPI00065A3B20|nr:hypothetical protein [Proteus vulgaris]CRL61887.1 Protein-tyrosine phosphatase [Proteus vulgaris]
MPASISQNRQNIVLPNVSEINCDSDPSYSSGEYFLSIKNTSSKYEGLFAKELNKDSEEQSINNNEDMENCFYEQNVSDEHNVSDKYNCSNLKEATKLGHGKKREINKNDYMLFEKGGNVIENQDSYYTILNGMKLPFFVNNVADKLNLYQERLREINLNGVNDSVLSKLENITLKEIGKQSNKLINNLKDYVYPKDKYTQVDNQRINYIHFCQDTLIKNLSKIFPANEMLTVSGNKAILSEYPLHTKEELNQYLKMLLNEDIDVVYILSHNSELFNINDIESIKKNNANNNSIILDKDKFKYFKYFNYFANNSDVALIGNNHEENHKEMYDNYPIANFELYTNNVSDKDKGKYIKFISINNWRAGLLMDPFILENTIRFIEKEKLNTDKYNFLIHEANGMNRVNEFFAIKEIMDTINSGGKSNQSLEDIIHQLQADRSPQIFNNPEILIELAAYALAKGIPLVK